MEKPESMLLNSLSVFSDYTYSRFNIFARRQWRNCTAGADNQPTLSLKEFTERLRLRGNPFGFPNAEQSRVKVAGDDKMSASDLFCSQNISAGIHLIGWTSSLRQVRKNGCHTSADMTDGWDAVTFQFRGQTCFKRFAETTENIRRYDAAPFRAVSVAGSIGTCSETEPMHLQTDAICLFHECMQIFLAVLIQQIR